MTDLPAAQANAMLAAALVPTTTYYLSLHTADPGTTGASEVSGGAGPYARQAITFGTPSAGSQASTSSQSFTGMPAVTIGWLGVWTAASSGTYLGGGTLATSPALTAGSTVNFASGAVTQTVT